MAFYLTASLEQMVGQLVDNVLVPPHCRLRAHAQQNAVNGANVMDGRRIHQFLPQWRSFNFFH